MSFSDFAELRYTSLVHFVTIEGIGSSAGLDKFCSKVPGYAAGDARYKPWFPIGSKIQPLPEKQDSIGGVADLGALPFTLMDGEGPDSTYPLYDYLTKAFGTDVQEDGQLQGAISAADASMTVAALPAVISKIDVGTILYMGSEALEVTAVTQSTSTTKTVDVDRAVLDTDAEAHDDTASVYLRTPYVEGRLVRLWFAYDEPGFVEADETEVGPGWTVDTYDLTEDLQAYAITTHSGRGLFDRQVNNSQFRGVVVRSEGADDRQLFLDRAEGALPDADAEHFGDPIFLQVAGEILAADWPSSGRPSWLVRRTDRGLFATQPTDIEPGAEVRQVLTVHPDWSSFRYQDPGAETSSRTTGVWNKEPHPIPIMLALFTSSARPSNGDGLELTNWEAGSGNYSGLPAGLGAGIPISKIRWASFHEIWARHPEWRLENLVLDRQVSLRTWLDENILRPFGIALTVDAGQVVAHEDVTAPVTATGSVTFGPKDILLERSGDGRAKYVLNQRRAKGLAAATVRFVAKNHQGVESRIEYNDSDFGQIFGNTRRHHRREGKALEIPVPGARFDGRGTDDFFDGRAFDLLQLHRRAPWEVHLSTDLSKAKVAGVFQIVRLTHPWLVNDRTRSRGWVDVPCRVMSKLIDRDAQKIDWVLLSDLGVENPGLVGRAAAVVDALGAPTVVIAPNRFTDETLPVGLGLPNHDALAFADGDVVRLRDRSGAWLADSVTETVTGIDEANDEITLSGDFGGALASGTILVDATYDDVADTQHEDVFWADGTDRDLGDAADPAYTYGSS